MEKLAQIALVSHWLTVTNGGRQQRRFCGSFRQRRAWLKLGDLHPELHGRFGVQRSGMICWNGGSSAFIL